MLGYIIAAAAVGAAIVMVATCRFVDRRAADLFVADAMELRARLGMPHMALHRTSPKGVLVARREALQRVEALRYLADEATAEVNEMGAALGLAPEPGETTGAYHRRQVEHVEALLGSWRLEGNGVHVVARRDGEG